MTIWSNFFESLKMCALRRTNFYRTLKSWNTGGGQIVFENRFSRSEGCEPRMRSGFLSALHGWARRAGRGGVHRRLAGRSSDVEASRSVLAFVQSAEFPAPSLEDTVSSAERVVQSL